MKLLICIASMEGGGAERQVAYLANGLADAGVDVYILLLRGGSNFNYLSKKIKNITVLNVSQNSMRLIFLIISEVRRFCPDFIYLWQRPFDILGGIASILLDIPFFYAERTDPYKIPAGIKVILRNWVVSKARGVLSNSNQGIKYWDENSKNLRFMRIKNIIPLEALRAATASIETKGRFVTVSRLDQAKNLESLIKAIHLLKIKGLKVDLSIIGSGPDEINLKNLVIELGLGERVNFLGYRQDAWSLMKGSIGYVSLSLFEGQPNSVLEAAALGCPLILSYIPAHLEFKSLSNVRLVDPFSLAEIASSIEHFIEHSGEIIFEIKDMEKFNENSVHSVVNNHLSFFNSI